MKFAFLIIMLLTYIVPIQSVKAEPSSCRASANTLKEQEVVGVLEELYLLQSNLKNTEKILDKLNEQITKSINRRNADTLIEHKDLINEYNRFIQYSDETKQHYKKLQILYNNLVNSITPYSDQTLLNCLNREGVKITTDMTRMNRDYLEIKPKEF